MKITEYNFYKKYIQVKKEHCDRQIHEYRKALVKVPRSLQKYLYIPESTGYRNLIDSRGATKASRSFVRIYIQKSITRPRGN